MTAASPVPAEASVPALAHAFADRCRTLPESRWRRSVGTLTLASAALGTAQLLADLAGGIEARTAAAAPDPRPVPDLGPFAIPDQIWVLAVDLDQALAGLDLDVEVWSVEGTRIRLADALQRAHGELRALYREV